MRMIQGSLIGIRQIITILMIYDCLTLEICNEIPRYTSMLRAELLRYVSYGYSLPVIVQLMIMLVLQTKKGACHNCNLTRGSRFQDTCAGIALRVQKDSLVDYLWRL